MSIIQEALKKAERKKWAGEAGPPQTDTAPKKMPFRIMPFFLMIFIAVTIFAALQFYLEAGSKSKKMTKVGADTAPHQEIIYKPVEDKKAGPDEPPTSLLTHLESPKPNFILNGIMYLRDVPQAIINNSLVREGDVVSSATVVKINKNSVVLNLNGIEIQLILKK